MKKKKTNENRIPVGRNSYDKDAILKEFTDGMVFRTWALTLAALSSFTDTTAQTLLDVWAMANTYTSDVRNFQDAEKTLDSIYRLTGVRFSLSYIYSTEIRTQGELNRFIRKARDNAFGTSIAIIFEPLLKKQLLTEERLRVVMRKVFSMDGELAEGSITIQDIQDMLKDEYDLLLEHDDDGARLRPADIGKE